MYRPNSEHERALGELNRELLRRYNTQLELISMDSVEGDNLAQVYDVWAFPACLAIDQEGRLQHAWLDGQLPLINELSYYLGR